MTGFVLRRILSSTLVIILTSMFVFALFFMGMGDRPAVNYCDQLDGRCTPAQAGLDRAPDGLRRVRRPQLQRVGPGGLRGPEERVHGRKALRLPRPVPGHLDHTSQPVWTDLKQRYPATLTLAIGGAAIYLTGGVILGVMAARWRGGTTDRLIVGGTLAVSSIPLYVIVLLAFIFFPQGRRSSPTPATTRSPRTRSRRSAT